MTFEPKIKIDEGLIQPETVLNPQAVKKDPNNYTSLPSDCPSWNDYEEWCMYENTEFRAQKNFEECWGDVDRLKEKFGEVWLINVNSGPVIRPEEGAERYCFGFDLAIAATDEATRRKIKKLADDYRNIGSNGDWTTARAIKSIVPLMELAKSVPYVEDHFT